MNTAKMMTHQEKEKFVRNLFENYPEASMPSLRCVGWQYEKFQFKFVDEDGKRHTINLAAALRGFDRLVNEILKGKFPGLGLSANFLNDEGEWDAFAVDALAQMAIYGEVIYG